MKDKFLNNVILILLLGICVIILSTITFIYIYNSNMSQDVDSFVRASPTTTKYYDVSYEERELLARIVTCEASICSLECQKDICSVIFNRLESGKWNKDMNKDNKITVYDIIYYPNAFTPVLDGALNSCITPTESAYAAVDYVIVHGPTIPTEVRYFRADYDFSWNNYKNYKVIDNVYFGYFENWRNGEW